VMRNLRQFFSMRSLQTVLLDRIGTSLSKTGNEQREKDTSLEKFETYAKRIVHKIQFCFNGISKFHISFYGHHNYYNSMTDIIVVFQVDHRAGIPTGQVFKFHINFRTSSIPSCCFSWGIRDSIYHIRVGWDRLWIRHSRSIRRGHRKNSSSGDYFWQQLARCSGLGKPCSMCLQYLVSKSLNIWISRT